LTEVALQPLGRFEALAAWPVKDAVGAALAVYP